MLKKSSLLFSLALLLASPLYADNTATEAANDSEKSTTPAESPTAAVVAPIAEVPEPELIEMLGYLTARNGGVASLKLDKASLSAFVSGIEKTLKGEINAQDTKEEELVAAFAQARARAEAVEKNEKELPAIDKDALQKIGALIASRSGLIELGFGAKDASTIAKGFMAGSSADKPDPAREAKMPAFQKFIQARVKVAEAAASAKADALAAENIAKGLTFLKELSADTGVQKSASGLHYKIHKPGAETKPTMADKVLVHYKGTLIDGTQFDSSYDRGKPAEFPLNGVVAGFSEGLSKIGVGGKITLYIPSELGYGNKPPQGSPIKPGDMLIFECELVELNPASASEAKS